ncbi:MAG TPA: carboxylesterase/lipase family protein [Gemmatimonadales bacterium]
MTTLKMVPVAIASDARPVIQTAYGTVRGSVTEGVSRFMGIPFAAPPFGANRLRPPQPVQSWNGIRDALTAGPMPPQLPYPPPWDVLIPERATVGEDCLNLNIWTPERGSAGLPVMVWIPGGMFEAGSGATYDGSRFARDGIVCVTINYRVGAEGFLYLPDGDANLGLLDQVAALEWVRDNIASFGGDPGNVTVFGQSAGGMSVGTLLSMPRADGLFRRAMVQSGGAHQAMPAQDALKVAARLAERLGLEPTREAIATVPIDRLLRAQGELKADLVAHPDPERWGMDVVLDVLPWQPVIDGNVVPERPIDRIVAGAGSNIDLMAGSTTEEWNFFLVPSGAIDQIPLEAVTGVLAAYGLPVDAAMAAYSAAHPGASAGDLLAAIQSDRLFRIPALRLAEAHVGGSSATYAYEFAWRSPSFGGRLGACHGADVAFVFDQLGQQAESLAGPKPPQQLADTMHAAWIGFARNGNPGWPRYDLTRRATMRFDVSSKVVDDSQASERLLWQGVR